MLGGGGAEHVDQVARGRLVMTTRAVVQGGRVGWGGVLGAVRACYTCRQGCYGGVYYHEGRGFTHLSRKRLAGMSLHSQPVPMAVDVLQPTDLE